ncbi:MAG: hypothetical protein ABII00_05120 [Elusimicrobiota bacterium]
MRLPALAMIAALAAPAGAWTGNTGGSTAQFLRIGAGARALAMGEAFGPVAEGPVAIYWNPAGLAQQREPEIAYTHVEMLRYFHHDHIAYAHPVPLLRGTVGLSATFFYQDKLDLVTNANQVVGTFRPHSEAYTLAYARGFGVGEDYIARDRHFFQDLWQHPGTMRPLDRGPDLWTGNLLLGAALKIVKETIHDRSASAIAADGGALFRHMDLPELAFSFAFRNVGSKPKFITQREDLPGEADFGAAYDLVWERRRLLPAFELAVPWYGPPFAKLGIEYSFPVADESTAALRLGYKSLSAPELGFLTGLTLGVGMIHKRFTFDFAFQPMGDLGEAYRFGLGYVF